MVFSTRAGIGFWRRHGRKHNNASEPRSAHTGFVQPVVARANRFNRPLCSECNLSFQFTSLPTMRRSAGSQLPYTP